CVYLPDDRTAVFDEEPQITAILRRPAPVAPAWLSGPDWQRASHGLFALALNNEGDRFTKGYDLRRPDDAAVVPLFRGVDRRGARVDDADAIALHAAAACRDSDAGAAIARAVESLRAQGRKLAENPEPAAAGEEAIHDLALRMFRGLLANLRLTTGDRTV